MPEISHLSPKCTFNLIGTQLITHGCCILDDVLSPGHLRDLYQEVHAYAGGRTGDEDNEFMGSRTVRFGRIMMRIPSARSLATHETVLPVFKQFIEQYSPTTQLHFSSVMHVQEGEKAQVLHRDISPFPNPAPTIVYGAMWALNDFTRDNGATVVVPGSHYWHDQQIPKREELAVAEMRAGSVLLYAGNLIHGAGACKSGSRTGLVLQYSAGWLRQEENQYLATPLNMVRGFPEDLQRLLGYDLAARHWGYVDQTHPMEWLTRRPVEGGLDPEGYQFPERVQALYVIPSGVHMDHRYAVTLEDE